jgi:peptidoglycan/LPS O-acetylase OafA/YrhL
MHSWPVKPDALLLTILWSVAVEEQFYLSWPVILRFVPLKWYKLVFPAIMVFSLVFRSLHTGPGDAEFAIRYFHTFSVIGDMALGGLFAYLVSYENRFKTAIVNLPKPAIIFIYLTALGLAFFKDELFQNTAGMIFDRLFIGCFFGLIILEQNYAKNSLFKMSNFKTMSKLGIYTYGLYCLHLMGLYFAIKVMNTLRLDGSVTWVAFAIFILAFVLALIISLSSYHLFEKWFLRWKDKFAFIVKK